MCWLPGVLTQSLNEALVVWWWAGPAAQLLGVPPAPPLAPPAAKFAPFQPVAPYNGGSGCASIWDILSSNPQLSQYAGVVSVGLGDERF